MPLQGSPSMARLHARFVEQITRSACTITRTLTDTIKTFACPGQLIFKEFLYVHHSRQSIAFFFSIRLCFCLAHTSSHKNSLFFSRSSHTNAS